MISLWDISFYPHHFLLGNPHVGIKETFAKGGSGGWRTVHFKINNNNNKLGNYWLLKYNIFIKCRLTLLIYSSKPQKSQLTFSFYLAISLFFVWNFLKSGLIFGKTMYVCMSSTIIFLVSSYSNCIGKNKNFVCTQCF